LGVAGLRAIFVGAVEARDHLNGDRSRRVIGRNEIRQQSEVIAADAGSHVVPINWRGGDAAGGLGGVGAEIKEQCFCCSRRR